MTQTALILFIKNIEAGKVKTRIAATAGDEMALKIYRSLVAHTREVALSVQAHRYVFYSDFIEKNDDWPAAFFTKKAQRGAGLGERMSNAITEVLAAHEKVV
ncbi:MAG: glycosyltransferase, partial [Saprospiraceae bacterium]